MYARISTRATPEAMTIDIRANDFELTDALRDRVERRVRLALSRFADRLEGVTVRLEQRGDRLDGDACYICEVVMAPVRLQIREEHDRIETAIDRALDRAARFAPLSLRHPPAPDAHS
jgi:ribosome-associated translation inhibitor RaiA